MNTAARVIFQMTLDNKAHLEMLQRSATQFLQPDRELGLPWDAINIESEGEGRGTKVTIMFPTTAH